ncbi:hypothetical protein AK812_SmicGene5957 [Symbiodinium microadriaticum]|uniref:Uncharacterized protein n=1 Tax=Symbiodinium microadriaticum TaxID=2951 RepID=A0A1Q9ESD8_SYMMI|nr:hypothetical protein AK812_SmicGene5957 [Symbiodinium microadriaticum]
MRDAPISKYSLGVGLAKRDPQQTKKEMLQHMHDLERTARAKKAAMLEKLQSSPRKTFWTAEEREALEVRSQLR